MFIQMSSSIYFSNNEQSSHFCNLFSGKRTKSEPCRAYAANLCRIVLIWVRPESCLEWRKAWMTLLPWWPERKKGQKSRHCMAHSCKRCRQTKQEGRNKKRWKLFRLLLAGLSLWAEKILKALTCRNLFNKTCSRRVESHKSAEAEEDLFLHVWAVNFVTRISFENGFQSRQTKSTARQMTKAEN